LHATLEISRLGTKTRAGAFIFVDGLSIRVIDADDLLNTTDGVFTFAVNTPDVPPVDSRTPTR
jgi:hypothetical protein